MPRYMISFDDGAMDHVIDELSAADEAAHHVVREAQEAGVWVTGGGLMRQQATIVDPDGSLRLGDFPEKKSVVGGFAIIEVKTLDDALDWAARIARACRCSQEVRVLLDDPEV